MQLNLWIREVLLATALASAPVQLSAAAREAYAKNVDDILSDSVEARDSVGAPRNIDLTKIDPTRLTTELKRIGFPDDQATAIQKVIKDMSEKNTEKLKWDAVLSGYVMGAELVRSPFRQELEKAVPGIFSEKWTSFQSLFGFDKITTANYEAFIAKVFDKPTDQKRWNDRLKQFSPEHAQSWLDFVNANLAHIEKTGYLNSTIVKQVFIATGSVFFYAQAKPESQLRIAPNTADQISRLYQMVNCDTLDPKLQVSGIKVLFGRTGKDPSTPDALKYTFFTPQALATSAVPMPAFTNDVTTKGVEGLQAQYKTYLDGLEADKGSAAADVRAQNADARAQNADASLVILAEVEKIQAELWLAYRAIEPDMLLLAKWWTESSQKEALDRLNANAKKIREWEIRLLSAQKRHETLLWKKDNSLEMMYDAEFTAIKKARQIFTKLNIPME